MEDLDRLYEIYKEYVSDEWEFGNMNGLLDEGWTVEQSGNHPDTVTHRIWTFDEFVDKKIYERRIVFNG
jgi:hypothetical protein